jgi:hypothetical protein
MCVVVLQVPPGQSPFTLQPPMGSQVPFVLHAPERHTVLALPAVHDPSPFAYPHLLSLMSQTPLTQTSIAAAGTHSPSRTGFMCGMSTGIDVPLASFGVHVPVVSSHQLPPVQSASVAQPPAGSQTPEPLHVPERQTVAPLPAVQGPSPFA